MGKTTSHRITVCTSCKHKGTSCKPGFDLIKKLRSAIEMAGDANGALKAYKTFRPMTQDTVILGKLDEFIKTLEETINQ